MNIGTIIVLLVYVAIVIISSIATYTYLKTVGKNNINLLKISLYISAFIPCYNIVMALVLITLLCVFSDETYIKTGNKHIDWLFKN